MDIYIYIDEYVYLIIHLYIHIYTHTYIYTHAYIYMYTHTCIYKYMYIVLLSIFRRSREGRWSWRRSCEILKSQHHSQYI